MIDMPGATHLHAALLFVALTLASGCGDDDCDPGSKPATVTPVPTATPVPLTSAEVLAPGPYGVGVTTLALEDTSRPTMPNRTFPGAPTRMLPTEVWYPAAPVSNPPADGQRDVALLATGAPYPLVVHSHGVMDRRIAIGFLARHLASHGYIVASPDFPLSNFSAPGSPTTADVPNQPGDVSFVIDTLLALNDDPQSGFAGAIDAERIGLSGLSLGGLTTSLTTFHVTLRDPRVRAAVSIAGPACFFGPRFYENARVPLLTLHGDIDAIVPYVENGRFQFATARPPKYLVTLKNASHTAFDEIGARLLVNNQDDIGCTAIGGLQPDGDTDPGVIEALGGAEAGIIDGDCPGVCSDPTPRPTSLRGPRQLDLTTLTIFPFFEAELRGDAAARQYLETGLAAENPEATVEFEH